MPKICVQSPEVVSQGEIKIHARVNVTTKAKLDEITVQGSCECADVPPPMIDVICLVDGSDSYNNKVNVRGKIEEGEAFDETNLLIKEKLVPDLARALKDRGTFTLVQFSGVKQLEKSYKPGSDGQTGTAGLQHYKIEVETVPLNERTRIDISDIEGLDGNGQLFLVLQDLNMDGFIRRLDRALSNDKLAKDQKRQRVLIIFSDEEWDVKNLDNAFGSGKATKDSVCAVNNKNYETFACIVRPNRNADQNEDFIKNVLCNGEASQRYHKVYTDAFENEMNRALDNIVRNLAGRRS